MLWCRCFKLFYFSQQDKITSEFGYKPVESSKQTLKDFVPWYNTDYKPNIEEL